MSRPVCSVAPLLDPFVLPPDLAAASPLHRRVLLVALPPSYDVAAELAALGVSAAAEVSTGLFADGLSTPWLAFQRPSDVGLAGMVNSREFLGALRGLADDLLMALPAPGGVVVDRLPAGSVDAVTVAVSLYPDATVVIDPALRDRLPAWAADRVVVPGSAHPVAAPPGVLTRPTSADGSSFRLLVMVGAGRSGTTWLEELLLTHTDVAGVSKSESWLFEQLHRLWLLLPASPWASASGQRLFVAALRRYADAVFTAMRRRVRPAATVVVEKTPVHSFRLRQIAMLYPDAHVLHVLRDGRAVARSMAEVPFFGLPDPVDAARLWGEVVTTVRRDAAALDHFHEVRYEELVADPRGRLEEIVHWIGLSPDGIDGAALDRAVAEQISRHRVGGATAAPLTRRQLAGVYRRVGPLLVASRYASAGEVLLGRLSLIGRPAAVPARVSR